MSNQYEKSSYSDFKAWTKLANFLDSRQKYLVSYLPVFGLTFLLKGICIRLSEIENRKCG